MQIYKTQSPESTGSTPLADTYKKPGRKIITKKGCMINFHGIFFFTDAAISERRPWKLTITQGYLPSAQEWARLQKDYNLQPAYLTVEEETAARKIAEIVTGDPMQWLTKEEAPAYVKLVLPFQKIEKRKYA